jgi:hypothetical protein
MFISLSVDLFILKNMGAAIIDFRVCPPLVKCKNLMFSGFIDTLMYGFSSTGVTLHCYFALKFNDNTCCEVICKWRYNDNDIMTTNKLPGMYFFLITVILPIQNQYKYHLIKDCMHFFFFFCCFSSIRNKMNCELMLTYDTPALWQTGSRNLTCQKTLPTIWGTYMKFVTKYQISAINSC